MEAYYYRGMEREILKDDSGAIRDYNKAIELSPGYAEAYMRRGIAEDDLQNDSSAIADYTRTIEMKPDTLAYYSRGIAKIKLANYEGAITDFTSAIEINPLYAQPYTFRGVSRILTGDKKGGCLDLKKAKKLGDKRADKYIKDACR